MAPGLITHGEAERMQLGMCNPHDILRLGSLECPFLAWVACTTAFPTCGNMRIG